MLSSGLSSRWKTCLTQFSEKIGLLIEKVFYAGHKEEMSIHFYCSFLHLSPHKTQRVNILCEGAFFMNWIQFLTLDPTKGHYILESKSRPENLPKTSCCRFSAGSWENSSCSIINGPPGWRFHEIIYEKLIPRPLMN